MSELHPWMRKFLVTVTGAVALLVHSATFAVTEPVVVQVSFVDPITITEVNALQFGLLDQNLANLETIALSAAEPTVVTDAANRVLGGTQAAAKLTVTATAGHTIVIDVDEVTEGAGYTLGSYVCKYDVGGSTACEASYTATSVASATLLVGVTMTGDGTAVPGAADGSINVLVTYQ